MLLRVCVFTRSYLQDIRTGCSLRAFHIDEGSFSSGSVPRFQFNLLQILNKKGLNYRYSFLELPFLIVRNVVHCVIDLWRRFGHMILPINLFGFLPYQTPKSKEAAASEPKQVL